MRAERSAGSITPTIETMLRLAVVSAQAETRSENSTKLCALNKGPKRESSARQAEAGRFMTGSA